MSEAGTMGIEETLRAARDAGRRMARLDADQRNLALETLAALIQERAADLLAANRRDQDQHRHKIAPSLYQRLGLDASKLDLLARGILDVAAMEDPVGRVLSSAVLDDGLVLEKVTVPLGVVAIIFESRPDVIPQVLSLILKSGNAVLLKGGSEASHSNRAFMDLVVDLGRRCPWLPAAWATLLEGREAVHELLDYPEHVDLVIPRGSNQMVRSIMEATRIPVLGHAEGVCHLYVHERADLGKAVELAIDAKAQYPAACNSIETLLVDESVAARFLPEFAVRADRAGIALRACPRSRAWLPKARPASESDWGAEFGDKTLAVKLVGGLDAAIEHINRHGSHHTDAIVTEDAAAGEVFLNAVDSAGVFLNASTRFADGYRYGLGAELGVSTARTHARGPVGVEGLVIYKYKLRGAGQVVSDYVGPEARPFKHGK